MIIGKENFHLCVEATQQLSISVGSVIKLSQQIHKQTWLNWKEELFFII